MPRTPRPVLFAIPVDQLRELDIDSLLDMLRYDGAEVVSNPPDGHYLFRKDSGAMPTAARWASFGIKDLVVLDEHYPRDINHGMVLLSSQAPNWVHRAAVR